MGKEVAVNGRFEGRRITGVDRYASEILRCLGKKARIISPRRSMTGVRGHFWEQFILPRMISKNELLWSPANSGPLAVSRQVVTIHDVGVLDHPEWFAPAFHLWYSILLPLLVRTVDRVLTVSEYSRQSIIKKFKLDDEKVVFSPNGVNSNQFHPRVASSVRIKYNLPQTYILFVGSIDPRKNISRLLLAWDALIDFPEARLVIAGSKARIFSSMPATRSTERVQYLGYVPDDELPALYSGATVFVMPSLFEGFGLTVLEAMACGTPVITSNAGALPEVTGEAAILINPLEVNQLSQAIRTVLSDGGLRDNLKEKGIERARQFSWDKSAERIWGVLSVHE